MAGYTRWVAKHSRFSIFTAAVAGFALASWLHGVRPELELSASSMTEMCVGDKGSDAPEEPRVHIPTDGLPHKGAAAADAKVTMLVCSDFECGFCKKAARTVNELLARNDDLAFYHLSRPLPQFEFAMLKALVAAAAHRQGAFWAMHDA